MTNTSKISLIVCVLVTMAFGLGHWAYPLPPLNVVIHYTQPPILNDGGRAWQCDSTADVWVSDCIVLGSTMDMTFEGCQ